MSGTKKSVLFVCLGNICRSPIAEAIFVDLLHKRGLADKWKVDSAALGSWHIGNRPDERAIAKLTENNVPTSHRARQLTVEDFTQFDVIFGMDDDNIRDITYKSPKDATARVELLGEYDPQGVRIIEDPYYGGVEGFEDVYQQCVRCCQAFLDKNST